ETKIQDVQSITSCTNAGVDSLKSDRHLSKLRAWLSPDPSTNLNAASEKRHAALLSSTESRDSADIYGCTVWLVVARPSSSQLFSTISIHGTQTDSPISLGFFFDFNDKNKQHLGNLLRSLAFHLYSQSADSRKELDRRPKPANNSVLSKT
ncbi:hypothetical protein MMYC01_207521, partial [Madurella mycetomatis]